MLYGAGLYVFLVWMLYGKREVLPTSLYKHFEKEDNGLKAAKRDPKEAVVFLGEIDALFSKAGTESMMELDKQLKEDQKGK